jgi:signal transduction histidine kinase
VCILGAATGLKVLINHVFGQAFPYMTYFLAVSVCAWLLKGWWGYFVALASCVIGALVFVEPLYSFKIGFGLIGHCLIFFGEASLIVCSLNRMHGAVRDAEAATRTRDLFMAIISHDLRNPLSVINMNTASMLRKDPENKPAASMQRAVAKMDRLIQQMVELSKTASGGARLNVEAVTPKEMLDEAIATISPSYRVHIEVEAQDDMTMVYWDRTKVDQILTNMLSNACKYGDGKPIHVVLEVHDLVVNVRVRDEGPGIPQAERERLFQPYARMSNAKGYDGLGLGLWVTRQLAEMMGGSVKIESEEGQGTVFSVTLPRKVVV